MTHIHVSRAEVKKNEDSNVKNRRAMGKHSIKKKLLVPAVKSAIKAKKK